jgi:hypothetical protein
VDTYSVDVDGMGVVSKGMLVVGVNGVYTENLKLCLRIVNAFKKVKIVHSERKRNQALNREPLTLNLMAVGGSANTFFKGL